MNQHVTVDGEASVVCDVNSVPKADIQWFMNGDALNGKEKKVVVYPLP